MPPLKGRETPLTSLLFLSPSEVPATKLPSGLGGASLPPWLGAVPRELGEVPGIESVEGPVGELVSWSAAGEMEKVGGGVTGGRVAAVLVFGGVVGRELS